MNLHSLKPAEGSTKKPKKRIGRGQGSGKGGTAARGHKGAQSRANYKKRRGDEGGQMPLHRRVPKRGFKNINRKEYKVFNVSRIEEIAEKFDLSEITPENLYIYKLISKTDKVKILGNGEIKKGLTFKVNAATAKAKEAIEAAGGTVEILAK